MIALEFVARPERLPWLLLAPLAFLLLRAIDRIRSRRAALLLGPRVAVLSAERSDAHRTAHRVLFAVGLFFALAATVHPTFGDDAPDLEPVGADVVLCLDVSRSMLAQDATPSRLARAQAEIRALAARAQGDRLALVAFAGEARLLVPLTHDLRSLATLADLADPSSVRRGGTDLGAAIRTALLALEGRPTDTACVVVLTDGENVGGRGGTPPEETGAGGTPADATPDAGGAGAADAAARQGIRVHTVAVGTARGSKIPLETESGTVFLRDRGGSDVISAVDVSGLRRLAARTRGTFVDAAATPNALVRLYEDHVLPRAHRATAAEGRHHRADRFQWPLLLALCVLLLECALPDRRRR